LVCSLCHQDKIKELEQEVENHKQQIAEDDDIMEALHQRIDLLEQAVAAAKASGTTGNQLNYSDSAASINSV